MAMEQILTDPDQLADYTNRFFTEVYPTDLRTDEQIAADNAMAQQLAGLSAQLRSGSRSAR